MSDIEIRDDREAGRLEAVADGEVVGHVEYFVLESPSRALVPVHTIVEPEHEGKGIAGSLAREPLQPPLRARNPRSLYPIRRAQLADRFGEVITDGSVGEA